MLEVRLVVITFYRFTCTVFEQLGVILGYLIQNIKYKYKF